MYRMALILSLATLGLGTTAAQVTPRTAQEEDGWRVLQRLGVNSYLGVNVADVDTERVKELKLKEERGVEIKRVEPDSPAEKAGLKTGDVVLEYNGQRVEGTESFVRMVRETPAGRSARMVVSREGGQVTLTATIGRRKESGWSGGRTFSFTVPPIPPIPPIHIDIPKPLMTMRTARLGLETESLSGQLADYFGVKEGVLVRFVDKDSAAEKAGLKAGDVITRVDGNRVSRARDVSDELRSSWDKKSIPFQVVRNHKEMTLNLELPERARSERRSLTIERQRL